MDVTYRDITTEKCNLEYKPNGGWLIVIQKLDSVSVYTQKQKFDTHFSDLAYLESQWDYKEDD